MVEVDVKKIAAEAEKVVETIVRVEPMVMTVGNFVPGAAPVLAMVHPVVVMLAPFIEKALQDLAAGNNGDALGSILEMIQHVTRGQPNSPILSSAREARENAMAAMGGNSPG